MPDLLPIHCLIYRSQASRALHEVTLVPLLRKARRYNQQANLSGLLVHTKGQFLQIIEGPEPALSDLFARIVDDPRHYDVHMLAYGTVPERAFADWRMAYAPTNEVIFKKITGFLPLAASPGLTAHPSAEVVQLLSEFMSGAVPDK